MKSQTSFISTLNHYYQIYPAEQPTITRVHTLVQTHPDAFYRTCQIGHITGSAWIVSADKQRCLLTHHRKLDRWLQLGGHADGEQAVEQVALREAREESGMRNFSLVKIAERVIPFDIDIHPIPATPKEPAHEHYDLRYLLIAEAGQALKISHESKDLRWFTWDEVLQVANEESIQRMVCKAQDYLLRRFNVTGRYP